MNENLQNGMQCSQFEALLAEALDQSEQAGTGLGTEPLSPEIRETFEAHRLSCSTCAPLYAEAREGMVLLRGLEEVDPPRNLVHNILAATSRTEATGSAAAVHAQGQTTWLDRLRQSLRPSLAVVLHSRFVTSFCMAFFSLSLTLTLAGVKITDLAKVDWHPTALRKSVVLQYTQLEARVMRYYDNMRLVYEVQKLKKAATPAQNDSKDNQPEQQNRNPRPEQEENYSQEREGSLVAQSSTNNQGAQL